MTRVIVPWVALLALLALEIGAALSHLGWTVVVMAPAMIGIVALCFMRLGDEQPLSRIFAIAGLFWLAVLIGLGGLDFLVRRDVPVPALTPSAQPR